MLPISKTLETDLAVIGGGIGALEQELDRLCGIEVQTGQQ